MSKALHILVLILCLSNLGLAQSNSNAEDDQFAEVERQWAEEKKSRGDEYEDDYGFYDDYEEDTESVGLFVGVLFILVLIVLFVKIGLIVVIVGCIAIAGVLGIGVISSTVVGVRKKSFGQGFKVFWIVVSTFIGWGTFLIGLIITNEIMDWWSSETAILIGLIGGLLISYLLARLSYFILSKIINLFKPKEKPIEEV